MRWEKFGGIFTASHQYAWLFSHAYMPTVEHLREDNYRVYFSSRNRQNKSQIGFFDINVKQPQRVSKLTSRPILVPGKAGYFDDAGTTPTWILNFEGKKYLYYVGWNLGKTIPFRNSLGLAISLNEGKTFERFSDGPIMDRAIYDPCFVASASILVEKKIWKMWYLSCISWERNKSSYQHRYHIKYAESNDGINWRREGVVCIDFKNQKEYAISRPCVIKESGIYRMWYSYRGSSYRIGYAESSDGVRWLRKDNEVGIDVSVKGWDSEMIEYPFVFQHDRTKIMLYNGNGYGKTGIGYAVLYE